ncbi:MAG: CotH kinase family protein, partial [Flavobacteriales bacterium]|nr:CotH kinase family protein [Flavobacteriales bacterium]
MNPLNDSRIILGWSVATAAIVVWGGVSSHRSSAARFLESNSLGAVTIDHRAGRVMLSTRGPGAVHYTLDGSDPGPTSPIALDEIHLSAFDSDLDRSVRIPTSIQWRPPFPGLPRASVIKARACEGQRCGPLNIRTLPAESHALPVVSLHVNERDFFDADEGIYVPGNAIFQANAPEVTAFARDHRWWKYPGNYLFRGKAWERPAIMEWITTASDEVRSSEVRLRINGNNTRGFPQHALRVYLEEPLDRPLEGGTSGAGHKVLLLRSGGNDQDRTFFADAVQHRICSGLGFDVIPASPCVVYLNGAYWGLHMLRERIDRDELARRHGGRSKDYTILEDRLVIYKGDPADSLRFSRSLTKAENWPAAMLWYADSINTSIDLDGFLGYMAAQIVLANSDWPDQNLKYFRYAGRDRSPGARDGRWHFVMGDSDLGLGRNGGAGVDMFKHVYRHQGPVARLFKAVMRSDRVRERFRSLL